MEKRIGRPTRTESEARRVQFLRLLAEGVDAPEAAKLARVKPERALAILTPIVQPLFSKAA